jgi:hypothetical protein
MRFKGLKIEKSVEVLRFGVLKFRLTKCEGDFSNLSNAPKQELKYQLCPTLNSNT